MTSGCSLNDKNSRRTTKDSSGIVFQAYICAGTIDQHDSWRAAPHLRKYVKKKAEWSVKKPVLFEHNAPFKLRKHNKRVHWF